MLGLSLGALLFDCIFEVKFSVKWIVLMSTPQYRF